MEQTVLQKRNAKLGEKVVAAMKKRFYGAYYCETKEEALQQALSLIDEGSTVTWGGSMSIQEIGLTKALHDGNYQVLDRDLAQTAEEKEEISAKAFTSDVFLMSANGISEDGFLVNIDGTGNRIAALAYGPKKVIVIAGMNKVVKSLEDAKSRARNTAAPINEQRFNRKTGCNVTGCCEDCMSEESICCQMLITRISRPSDRIQVILVGEDLGF